MYFFAVSDELSAAIYEHDNLKALLFLRDVLHTHSFFLQSTNWKNLHVRAKRNHYEIFRCMRGDHKKIDRRGGEVNCYLIPTKYCLIALLADVGISVSPFALCSISLNSRKEH